MKIPVSVDSPPQLLGKDLDEVVVMSVVFVFGIILSKVGYSLIVIFFVSKAYKKFRSGVQANYLLHVLYWAGIVYPKCASVLNPFVRKLS